MRVWRSCWTTMLPCFGKRSAIHVPSPSKHRPKPYAPVMLSKAHRNKAAEAALLLRCLDTQRPTHDNEAPPGLDVVYKARPSQPAAAILGVAQTMASALDGITVLDLTDGPAGALTTMFLCDHGARVIRVVDSSDTTSRRGGYLVWDRGKECIRLDLARIVPPAQPSHAGASNAPTASDDPTIAYERLLCA